MGENYGTPLSEVNKIRKENKDLRAEVERLNQVIAWWMGEGSDETRHPEENEYLKLASVPESQRTKKQVARLGEIARLMRACSETSEYTKYREIERLEQQLAALSSTGDSE